MADTRITDAEIAGYMGWRGPGAYTEASLRKIREIIDHVLRAERATPPSPSTAPEVDERAAFEAWAGPREFDLRRPHKTYHNTCTDYAWMGWQARAALASRPAEVDDEGLPNFLAPATAWMVGRNLYLHHDAIPAGLLPPIGNPEPLFSVKQFRQGQRDAVAADRARLGLDLLDAAEAILEVLDSYPEQLVPINRMSATVTRLRESVAQEQFKLERGRM